MSGNKDYIHIDMTGMIIENMLLLISCHWCSHATEILLAGNSKLVGGYPLSDLIIQLVDLNFLHLEI